jgi:hypothetical protein
MSTNAHHIPTRGGQVARGGIGIGCCRNGWVILFSLALLREPDDTEFPAGRSSSVVFFDTQLNYHGDLAGAVQMEQAQVSKSVAHQLGVRRAFLEEEGGA